MEYIYQEAIAKLTLRADKMDSHILCDTFVHVGSLLTYLSSNNNHVLYGRRGTGKTHILEYLKSTLEQQGHCALYIDMRTVGSNRSIYQDFSIPFQQRAARLIIDVSMAINDGVSEYMRTHGDGELKAKVDSVIAQINEELSRVHIDGNIRSEVTNEKQCGDAAGAEVSFGIHEVGLHANLNQSEQRRSLLSTTREGKEAVYIHFPSVTGLYNQLVQELHGKRIVIIIDEYAEIPEELQPYLADMLRRTFISIKGVNIKIGAIEHRSKLRLMLNPGQSSSFIGLEIGADCSSCNLDEYMVFNNNKNQSIDFFKELLQKHINKELPAERRFMDGDEMMNRLFSNHNALAEWVRAAEGVPRDGLNILEKAIQIDSTNKISIPTLRKAARQWYEQDKEQSVSYYPDAKRLLHWIIDTVIGRRHSRAFLLNSSHDDKMVNYLYDSRVLHIIKTNVSGSDRPGLRHNVYAIDYGCYCNLANTVNNPQRLFEAEDVDGHEVNVVDVPADDYRSIRRAILDLDEFYRSNGSSHE